MQVVAACSMHVCTALRWPRIHTAPRTLSLSLSHSHTPRRFITWSGRTAGQVCCCASRSSDAAEPQSASRGEAGPAAPCRAHSGPPPRPASSGSASARAWAPPCSAPRRWQRAGPVRTEKAGSAPPTGDPLPLTLLSVSIFPGEPHSMQWGRVPSKAPQPWPQPCQVAESLSRQT